jgi:long-chain fatty acid transport protein
MKLQVSRSFLSVAIALLLLAWMTNQAQAQSFGVLLQGNLMPASGGMGGASAARPQDLQSALAINPATLTQRKGTQFSFSGSWVEPTVNIDNDATLPLANIGPYDAKSQRPGSVVGNIGVTQDVTALGLPATLGTGLLTASGLGADYRDEIASNGTSAEMAVLATAMGGGVELTDRLAVGVVAIVATANMDGIFTGVSSSTPDYNLRALMGFTYDLTDTTTVGGFWHTQEKHTFEDFVRIGGPGNPFQDFKVALPNVYGIGIANRSLVDGRLLLAVDLSYIEWSDADFFEAIWEDQFTVQTGIQFTTSRGIHLRLGYVYAENATRSIVAPSFGPITPQETVDYVQALFPNINEHRMTGGIGMTDVLPGIDVDLFAGGMFNESYDYGATSAAAESYWIGFGTTWRFGRGGCKHVRVPDRW